VVRKPLVVSLGTVSHRVHIALFLQASAMPDFQVADGLHVVGPRERVDVVLRYSASLSRRDADDRTYDHHSMSVSRVRVRRCIDPNSTAV